MKIASGWAASKRVPLLYGKLILQFSSQEVNILQINCTYIRGMHIARILISDNFLKKKQLNIVVYCQNTTYLLQDTDNFFKKQPIN